jgi:hypothetical protein
VHERPLGIPDLHLINLTEDEESNYIEDADSVMKKYRKFWRYIFFKYSSFGLKSNVESRQPEEKINAA